MPKYVIERDLPGIGKSSAADLQGIRRAPAKQREKVIEEICRLPRALINRGRAHALFDSPRNASVPAFP